MGRSTARSRVLSCFGCGIAGPSRMGSEVAVSKANNGPLRSPYFTKASSGSSKFAADAVPEAAASRPPTAGSARRPSYAFAETAQQASIPPESPASKVNNLCIAAAEASSSFPSSPPAAAAAAPQTRVESASCSSGGSATAGISVATAAAVDPSGDSSACREASPAVRHQPRKPRVRTSRVSPTFDTEDELSPAAGVSRTPSDSAAGSSSRAYSASLPPQGPLLEESAVENVNIDEYPDSASSLMHGFGDVGGGGGGLAKEVRATAAADGGAAIASVSGSRGELCPGDGTWLQQATAAGGGRLPAGQVFEWDRDADADRDAGGPVSHPGAVCTESLRKLASPKSAEGAADGDSGVGGVTVRSGSGSGSGRGHNRASASSSSARKHSASRGNGSRSLRIESRSSAAAAAGEGKDRMDSSRSNSRAGRQGSGRDGGYRDAVTAAAAYPVSDLRFPEGPVFTRHSSMHNPATSAAATAISRHVAADNADLPDADADADADGGGGDGDGDGGGGGVAAAAVRRNSFAGDSSTSLVGPGMVSETTQLEQCPSLRLDPGSPKSVETPPTLTPCESLRLSPHPPPMSPLTLQTCGSLRLTPISPPRPLVQSPSLRPTPPLLPSPSLSRNSSTPTLTATPPTLQQLVLPPNGMESAAAKGSPSGDMMLRLPPPQPPLFQHSPCSLTRGSYVRANALAPLVKTSAAATDNPVALNRLASLQAAFHEHQPGNRGPKGDKTQPSAAAAALLPGSPAGSAAVVSAAEPDAVDGPVAAGGCGGGDDDGYDDDSFCEDDVDAMAGNQVPPPSSNRSSASAVPFGRAQYTKNESLRRTASMDTPWPFSTPIPNHSTGIPLAGRAVGKVEAGLVSEAALEPLECYAPMWLEELLPPPSPGYQAQRPSRAAADAQPRRTVVAAPDSFRSLMREIE
ncbi:hypothetical protein VaNZ11_009629 [Volvox africanus]|uniref:Uncharacterized protein n=1 Tax=Volvox africanus TaxID=51714 RepID=A0ABQ5S8W3_9CHLO|nr:hypothetical protein VaNZ11_009629 [Volvox africanus]